MTQNVTAEGTTPGAIGRPWWQVRRTLLGALLVVCAAPGVVWLNADYREALLAAVVRPFTEAAQPLLRFDFLVALACSTGMGLLVGWAWRRIRAWRAPALSAQAA